MAKETRTKYVHTDSGDMLHRLFVQCYGRASDFEFALAHDLALENGNVGKTDLQLWLNRITEEKLFSIMRQHIAEHGPTVLETTSIADEPAEVDFYVGLARQRIKELLPHLYVNMNQLNKGE